MASIFCGRYKKQRNYGGVFAIAVLPSYQNKGLGKYLILLGYNKLKQKGYEFGESVISSYRIKSLVTHLKCGFFPQTNVKLIAHKDSYFNKTFLNRLRGLWVIFKLKNFYYKNNVQ